jgi:hypothetical protein
MSSLIDFKCETQSTNCLLHLKLYNKKSSDSIELIEDKVSLIMNKEQLSDLTQGMAAIRQQLFDATNHSSIT